MDPLPQQVCFPSGGHILRLSDEIILMILRKVTSKDLFSIYRTCKRLRNICCEESLWRKIDSPPDDYHSLNLVFKRFLHDRTTFLRIQSKSHSDNKAYKPSFAPSHLLQLFPSLQTNPFNCSLTHLYIIRQRIDRKLFDLRHLPSTLKVLHLTGTTISDVSEQSFYFKEVWRQLPNLEDFDLTDCTWVSPHSLLGLSKFQSLQRLCLRGCRQIGNCLAYSSLAFRFGFKTLKILDVTNTHFGTGEFHSVVLLSNLQELYVGDYDGVKGSDGISDFSLTSLQGLRQLKLLDVSGQHISDAGLYILVSITSLKQINAHFTCISEEAIEKFKNSHPSLCINKCNCYQSEV